jgi:hypothetical protein
MTRYEVTLDVSRMTFRQKCRLAFAIVAWWVPEAHKFHNTGIKVKVQETQS